MGGQGRKKLVEAGARAPEFRLQQLNGAAVTLAQLKADGAVLLAFFKVSCPVCQMTLPYLERLHAGGGIRVVGISQNSAEDTADFASRFGLSFPLLLDAEEQGFPASDAYGISNVPTLFLVGDGAVSQVIEGWNRREIEELGAMAGVTVLTPADNVPAWKAG